MFEPMSNRSNEDNKPPKADDKSKSKGKKLYRTTSTFTPANPAYPIFGTSVLSTVYAKNLKAFAEQAGGDATKCSRETAQSIMKLEKVTMAAPADLPPRATNTERMMQEMKIKRLVDREFTLDDNLAKCLNILLGNCTPELRAELEATTGFDAAETEGDVIKVLKMIKEIIYNVKPHKDIVQSIVEVERMYHRLCQGRHETTQDYVKRFKDIIEAHEHSVGILGHHNPIVLDVLREEDPDVESIEAVSAEELEDAKDVARERYLASSLIIKANRAIHSSLVQDLENREMTTGSAWPQTLSDAIQVLTNWKIPKTMPPPSGNDGINFAMKGNNLVCHRCGKPGHIAANCDGERITKGGKENKATSLMMAAAYDSDDDEDLYKASMCF